MRTPLAIVAAGLIVAVAILIVERWQLFVPQPTAPGIVRLDRWTGAIDMCAMDAKTIKGDNIAGAKITCEQ
jgi:hypothetical protein